MPFTLDQPVRPIWHKTGATSATPVAVLIPNRATSVKVEVDVLSLIAFSSSVAVLSTTPANAVQTIKALGVPTGGNIKVAFANKAATPTTATITFGDTFGTIDTALEALTTIGTGGVTVAGGPFGTADLTVTFDGAVFTGTEVPLIQVVTNALTGGTNPSAIITTTTAGVQNYSYQEASTQELYTWTNEGLTFLNVATVAGTGNYRVSAFV